MEYAHTPYIQQLADHTSTLCLGSLPPAVIAKLKICLYDALECCISPMNDERGQAALASIVKDGDTCRATVFRTGHRADAADAAFYNTVKGAITSRNDTCLIAGCHPGSVLVPVVFALAEETHANGARVLEALLAGYDSMIRFGSLLAGRVNHSWRSTALSAPVGAAFAAAKMAGLDARQTASAASFACHSCGGVNEWAVAGTGEDVFQNGWGARNGILAMRLAQGGAVGCDTILEGESGLLSAYGISGGWERMTHGMGDTWPILKVIHKPIDSCYMVQNPSQTAAKLLRLYPELRASDIDHIKVEVTRSAKNYPGCANNQHIGTLVQGIMSIALGVASTLYNGSCANINWMPPIEPGILDLMRRCDIVEDAAFTAAGHGSARVTVYTKDGGCLYAEQDTLIPLTPDQVLERFRNTCSAQLGMTSAQRLGSLIENIETLPEITEITRILA